VDLVKITSKTQMQDVRKALVDALAQFKQLQKEGWAKFAPLEALTTPTAARLVSFANIQPGQYVLDVGCGTGVVAITAARLGARVSALDLTPELLAHARESARIAGVNVDWHEGDAEQLPFGDAEFDVVVSQFAHIFAPRPAVATAEMLRVLKPGGTIAFSTWPPEYMVGRSMALAARYMPPPPPGVEPPTSWGRRDVVRERLGSAVKDLTFETDSMRVPTLSPQHNRLRAESTVGPINKLVHQLSTTNPEALAAFRQEFESIVTEYLHDNVVRQEYLLTRAVKC
jgi:2-polyprenyl-3-methyl-5-hydroxy-6-metoxy-1,4-benzoquinol methylase